MTIGDFFTMAAVIVAACLVYNFVKAYTKKIIESGKKSTKKESILTTNSRCSPLMIFNYVQRTIPPISLLTLS